MLHERWCFAICLSLSLAGVSLAGQLSTAAIVERVVDGDTIVVSGVGVVRFIGVDTPEAVDPRKPVEHFALQASSFTRRLVDGQVVRLEYEGPRKDAYGRTLAYVYLPDGTLVNRELISQGYAHAYTESPFSKMESFRVAQREAMIEGRGLWAPPLERTARSSPQPSLALRSEAGAATPASSSHETVFATKTGAKYHRAGCRYLARSQIPISLREASERYGPCSVCNPPVLHTPVPTGAASAPDGGLEPPRPAATSARCQATTRRGTQCSRNAQRGRNYCWQH